MILVNDLLEDICIYINLHVFMTQALRLIATRAKSRKKEFPRAVLIVQLVLQPKISSGLPGKQATMTSPAHRYGDSLKIIYENKF